MKRSVQPRAAPSMENQKGEAKPIAERLFKREGTSMTLDEAMAFAAKLRQESEKQPAE